MNSYLYNDNLGLEEEMNTQTNKGGLFLRLTIIAICLTISLFVPKFNILTLIICVFFVMRGSIESVICYLMFMTQFTLIFKLNLGGFSLFNILLLFAFVRIATQGIILKRNQALFFVILALYGSLISISSGLVNMLSLLLTILIAMITINNSKGDIDFCLIVRVVAFGIIIASVIGLFKDSIPNLSQYMNIARIKMDAGVYYYRFSGLSNNPNEYTVFVNVAIAALIVMLFSKAAKFIDYGLIAVLIVFGLMSVSKSFLIALLAMAFCIFIFNAKSGKSVFAILLVSVGLMIAVYFLLDEETLSTILFRISSNSNNDVLASITTGRTEIWMMYFNNFISDPFGWIIGHGLGSVYYRSSHNFFIEVLYELGLLGSVSFLGLMVTTFRKKDCVRVSRIYYVPLIVFFVRCFARSLLSNDALIFMIWMCSMSIQFDVKQSIKGREG